MGRYVLVVFAQPVAGQEAEFNEFYDKTHLAEMVAVEGVVSARRLRVEREPSDTPLPGPYLVMYEIEGDLDAVQGAITEGRSGRTPIPSAVAKITSFWMTPLGEPVLT